MIISTLPPPVTIPFGPATPSGFAATSGNGTATFSWNAMSGVNGFRIQSVDQNGQNGVNVSGCTLIQASATTCSVSGLTNGATSYYVLQSYTTKINLVGGMPVTTFTYSSPTQVQVLVAGRPGPPMSVQVLGGDRYLRVSWQAPTNNGGAPIIGYTAKAWSSSDTSLPPAGTCSTTDATTCTIAVANQSTSYLVLVSASNGLVKDGAGKPVSCSDAKTIPPGGFPCANSAPFSAIAIAVPSWGSGRTLGKLSVLPGDGSVTATFDPVAFDGVTKGGGATAITSYTVTAIRSWRASARVRPSVQHHLDRGHFCKPTPLTTSMTCTVTGLTNDVPYYVVVTASNGRFAATRAPSGDVTPAGAPLPPQSLAFSPGDRRIALTWSPPASDGGSPILSYKAVAYDAVTRTQQLGSCSTLASGSQPAPTTCSIDGLTNGVPLYVTVVANNATKPGVSAPATTVALATTTAPPSSPTGLSVQPLDGAATVSWSTPATGCDEGCSYRVIAQLQSAQRPAVSTTFVSTSCDAVQANACTLTGLSNAKAYRFVVVASNAFGSGAASDPSAPVSLVPSTAPSGLTVAAGDRSAVVRWIPPGLRPDLSPLPSSPHPAVRPAAVMITPWAVSGYTVTLSPGGATCSAAATSTTCSIGSLVNGTTYKATVVATFQRRNGLITETVGGAASQAVPLTPATIPSTPAAPSVRPLRGGILVSWSAPANGGSPITSTVATAQPGGLTCSAPAGSTSCVIIGLKPGESYTVALVASNVMGASATSPGTKTEIKVVPSVPTGLVVGPPSTPPTNGSTLDPSTAVVTWHAPDDGGSLITGYQVGATGGPVSIGTPSQVPGNDPTLWRATLTQLAPSTAYTVTVSATNAVGTSPAASFGPFMASWVLLAFDRTNPDPTSPLSQVALAKGATVTNRGFMRSAAPDGSGGLVAPDLSGLVLDGIHLDGSDLTGAKLNRTSLVGATFRSTRYVDGAMKAHSLTAELVGVDLRGANLRCADLRHADLMGANLQGADLSRADLSGASLMGADLTGATLTGASLTDGTTGADLSGAVLSGVDLTGNETTCDGSQSIQRSFVGVALTGANLIGANLQGADLTGASLQGANLSSANLTSTVLGEQHAGTEDHDAVDRSADLSGATLDGTNLSGTVFGQSFASSSGDFVPMSAAHLFGIKGSHLVTTPSTTLPPRFFFAKGYLVGPGVNLDGADLQGLTWSGVDLTGASLQGANLTGSTIARSSTQNPSGPLGVLAKEPTWDGGSTLSKVDLTGAILTNTSLDGVDLRGATLTNVVMGGARVSDLALVTGLRSGGISGAPAHLPVGYYLVGGYLDGPGVDLSGAAGLKASCPATPGGAQPALSLASANLSGADLSGCTIAVDLSSADLTGANVADVDLAGSSLARVRTSGLRGIPRRLPAGFVVSAGVLIGPGVDLSGMSLTEVTMRGSSLRGADLGGSKLPANVWDVDLSGADLSGADLSGTDLSSARLATFDSKGGWVAGVRSGKTIVDSLTKLPADWRFDVDPGKGPSPRYLIGPGADLRGATLTSFDSTNGFAAVNLSSAHLAGAQLDGADLRDVSFRGADLKGASLAGADLRYADLSNALLHGASLSGARLIDDDALPTGVSTQIRLVAADLSSADLSGIHAGTKNPLRLDVAGSLDLVRSGGIQGRVVLPAGWQEITCIASGSTSPCAPIPAQSSGSQPICPGGPTTTVAPSSTTTTTPTSSGVIAVGPGGYLVGPKADLTGAILTSATLTAVSESLTGQNLAGAVLTGSDLTGADLSNARLSAATLTGSTLVGTKLTGADVAGAISGKVLSGGKCGATALPSGTALDGGWLVGAGAALPTDLRALDGLNLAGVNLRSARLEGRTFVGTNLTGADLTAARLDNTTFNGAVLTNAHLASTSWPGAMVTGTDLTSADLSGASLGSARFTASCSTAVLGASATSDASTLTILRSDCLSSTFPIPATIGSERILITGPATTPGDFVVQRKVGGTMASSYVPGTPVVVGGADILRSANLRGSSAVGTPFVGADLTLATLDGANLSTADLSGVLLTGASVAGTTLTGAVISSTSGEKLLGTPAGLPGPAFAMVKQASSAPLVKGAGPRRSTALPSTTLPPITIPPTVPDRYSLVGPGVVLTKDTSLAGYASTTLSLAGAQLNGTSMVGAGLAGVDLHGAHLNAVDASGATLSTGSKPANMAGASFVGSIFAGQATHLDSADLSGALLDSDNFSSASMTSVRLVGATLGSNDFHGADLSGADLSNLIHQGAGGGLRLMQRPRPRAASAPLDCGPPIPCPTNVVVSTSVDATVADVTTNGVMVVRWDPVPTPTNAATAGYPPITGYTATASPGGKTCTVLNPLNSCVISGLSSTTAYSVGVVSLSPKGTSPSQPALSLSSPLNVRLTPDIGKVQVSWSPPASDGGSAVTSYTATATPGGLSCTATVPSTSCTIVGLASGTTYSFAVTASTVGGGRSAEGKADDTGPAMAAQVWTGAKLSGAKLVGDSLVGARLDAVQFVGTDLSALDLSGADLGGSNLSRANLTGVKLVGTTSGSIVADPLPTLPSRVKLVGGFLFGPGVSLQVVSYKTDSSTPPVTKRSVSPASLRCADLSKVDLSGADLKGVTFVNVNLAAAILSGAALDGAKLSDLGSKTCGTIVRGSLAGANLTGASMTNVLISAIDITNADLTGTNLTNATFVNVTTSPKGVSGGRRFLPTLGVIAGPGAKLDGKDLTGLDLSNLDLTGASFVGATLSGTNLSGSTLVGVLSGSIKATTAPILPAGWGLAKGYLLGAKVNLAGADLSGANLSGLNLSGVRLTCTSPDATNPKSICTTLDDADLTNANLTGADLSGASMRRTKLGGADLSGASLVSVASSGILTVPRALPAAYRVITGSCVAVPLGYLVGPGVDLTGANLCNLDLSGVDLSGAVLTNATLGGGTKLTGAKITRLRSGGIAGTTTYLPTGSGLVSGYLVGPAVDLTSASIPAANLSGIDLTGAVLKGANLSNANLSQTTLAGVSSGNITAPGLTLPSGWKLAGGYLVGPSANLARARLDGVDLTGANLSDANLSDASLANANLTNVTLSRASIDRTSLFNVVTTNLVTGGLRGLPTGLAAATAVTRGYLIAPLVNLDGALLGGLDLSGLDLSGARLSNVNLTGTKLFGTRLTGVSSGGIVGSAITDAGIGVVGGYLLGPSLNLANARLANASISGIDLSFANLSGSNLSFANLNTVFLQGANLHLATLRGIRSQQIFGAPVGLSKHAGVVAGRLVAPQVFLAGVDLSGADLRNMNLSGANLMGANLTGALVGGASFAGADLTNARLVDLRGPTPSDRRLIGTDWTGATFDGADTTGSLIIR